MSEYELLGPAQRGLLADAFRRTCVEQGLGEPPYELIEEYLAECEWVLRRSRYIQFTLVGEAKPGLQPCEVHGFHREFAYFISEEAQRVMRHITMNSRLQQFSHLERN